MQGTRMIGGIGAAILVAAIALILWRGRHVQHGAPTAADIHVPPPPFAAYGH